MKRQNPWFLLKTTFSFSLLCCFLFSASTAVQAQVKSSYQLENLKTVTTGVEYSMPVWSPDGTKLLIASAHGMKLRMVDLKAGNTVKKLSEVRGSGFDASWSADGQTIFYRHRDEGVQDPEVRAISLDGYVKKSSYLNPNGILSASKATKASDPVVFINMETLGIEGQTNDQSDCWKITEDNGKYYRPLLSPDKSKLIVHEGSQMILYEVSGKRIAVLGDGIASDWSPDSKHVMAFLDESNDGHHISGSELYLIDVNGGTMSKLTGTAKVAEMWPNWSPDGKKIAFEDVHSGNIVIADIVKQ